MKKILSVALALTFAFSASAFAESRTSGTHHKAGTHITSHGKTAKIKSAKAKGMRIKSTAKKGMRTKSISKGMRAKSLGGMKIKALPKTGFGGTSNE